MLTANKLCPARLTAVTYWELGMRIGALGNWRFKYRCRIYTVKVNLSL
jgi:hypothetical protein